jgi:hypothetical protein
MASTARRCYCPPDKGQGCRSMEVEPSQQVIYRFGVGRTTAGEGEFGVHRGAIVTENGPHVLRPVFV